LYQSKNRGKTPGQSHEEIGSPHCGRLDGICYGKGIDIEVAQRAVWRENQGCGGIPHEPDQPGRVPLTPSEEWSAKGNTEMMGLMTCATLGFPR
jgi:hypothetical protein